MTCIQKDLFNKIMENTICAISSPPGTGGIAVIRISGSNALAVSDKIYTLVRPNEKLADKPGNTVHFGQIRDKENLLIDDVLATVFRAPHSFTG